MRLHIIIPVVNECDNLRELLPYLMGQLAGRGSITVADGGSTDGTEELLTASLGGSVGWGRGPSHKTNVSQVKHLSCPTRGRAPQMNAAAADLDNYDVLYFVHADTRPPAGFYEDIQRSIEEGFPVGCYRFRFDSGHPLLVINSFFTRFDLTFCRGGDQSLYLTREAWQRVGGFDGSMKIMEDYDIIQRLRQHFAFRIMPRSIRVSARKYQRNSWLRVQLANWKIVRMYRAGAPQQKMVDTYRRLLQPW